jgi:hypothetical protein
MARKRWTPKEEITDALLRTREKRKWQLAYRRYVLEKLPSEAYAHYFGLDNATLRQWFECQFTADLNWDNFGKAWQFDHILPATYFDYSVEEDLYLCWSFINMRVEPIDQEKNPEDTIDLLSVKTYFTRLWEKTGLALCGKMLKKITAIEARGNKGFPAVEQFINQHKEQLESIGSLNREELASLNEGMPLASILLEREILRKFSAGPQA